MKHGVVTERAPGGGRRTGARRVVHVCTLYHQASATEQPRAVECPPHARAVKSDEQMYGPRHCRATAEWQPLDLGWFRDKPQEVGTVVLFNRAGTTLQRIPTPEQQASIDASLLEVGVLVGDGNTLLVAVLYVHPGDSQPLCPVDPAHLMVRCPAGDCAYDLTIIPG